MEDTRLQGSLGKFEFTEPRVIQLWLLAKKANFSDVELESLKVRNARVHAYTCVCLCVCACTRTQGGGLRSLWWDNEAPQKV